VKLLYTNKNKGKDMKLKELRMDMMKSKKANPERAKVLQAILGTAQLIAKEDGNRDVSEADIIKAVSEIVFAISIILLKSCFALTISPCSFASTPFFCTKIASSWVSSNSFCCSFVKFWA